MLLVDIYYINLFYIINPFLSIIESIILQSHYRLQVLETNYKINLFAHGSL